MAAARPGPLGRALGASGRDESAAWWRPAARTFSAPDLAAAPLAEVSERIATRASERSQAAAAETTGTVLPPYVHPEVQIAPHTIDARSADSGISRRQQIKLDVLARHPDQSLITAVRAGRTSVHAACVAAGIAKPTATFPLDPVAMARAIRRRLDGEPGGEMGWTG